MCRAFVGALALAWALALPGAANAGDAGNAANAGKAGRAQVAESPTNTPANTPENTPASAPEGSAENPLHFGVLPMGGEALESRQYWDPLLTHLTQSTGIAVTLQAAHTYEALAQAIERGEVDLAFLSGKLAVDAVTTQGMQAIAQVSRHDGLPGYRAVLLAHVDGPVGDLEDVLAQPGRWRLARGSTESMSGYIVPHLELFLPRGIRMETGFGGEFIGNHQAILLAVTNRQADLGLTNTADLERFRLQFPAEAAQIRTLWSSELIPHGVIVMRANLPQTQREQIATFLVGYARAPGLRGQEQRAVLKALHDFAGFLRADNRTLLPAEKLYHAMAVQSAHTSRWVNEQARDAHLERLEAEHGKRMQALGEGVER